jgi:hypothetical protein
MNITDKKLRDFAIFVTSKPTTEPLENILNGREFATRDKIAIFFPDNTHIKAFA